MDLLQFSRMFFEFNTMELIHKVKEIYYWLITIVVCEKFLSEMIFRLTQSCTSRLYSSAGVEGETALTMKAGRVTRSQR